jgi:hypothetical protein
MSNHSKTTQSSGLLAKSMPHSLSGPTKPLPPSLSAPVIDTKKRILPNAKQIQQQQMKREGNNSGLSANNTNTSTLAMAPSKMASTSSFWALSRDERSADDDDEMDCQTTEVDGALGSEVYIYFCSYSSLFV